MVARVRFIPEPISWTCPVCAEGTDPTEKGGVVGHENGGELHPQHRDCMIRWFRQNGSCMSCRRPIDPSPVMSYPEWMIALPRILRSRLETPINGVLRLWNQPATQAAAGTLLIVMGSSTRLRLCIPIGTYLCSKGLKPTVERLKQRAAATHELTQRFAQWIKYIEARQSALKTLSRSVRYFGTGFSQETARLQDVDQEGVISLMQIESASNLTAALNRFIQEEPDIHEAKKKLARLESRNCWTTIQSQLISTAHKALHGVTIISIYASIYSAGKGLFTRP